MSPDTIALIILSVAMAMVGAIYASIRKQQDAIEARHTMRLDKLEAKLEKEVADMNTNIRHRVAEMNIATIGAIQTIPVEEMRKFSARAERLSDMLTKRGQEQIIDLDKSRRAGVL